jgi:hypothetical protein
MKKLLTVAALLSVASWSFGQGYVNFANTTASSTHVSTNSVVGGANTGRISGPAGSYYFALFVAPNGTAFNPELTGWSLVGIAQNTGTLGRFFGSTDTNGQQVPGYGISSTASFLVAGWSANLGTTWQAVLPWYEASRTPAGVPTDGFFGFSRVASDIVLGGGSIPVPNLFGAAATQATGFQLGLQTATVIPEPSSFALAGLGAAALMIFRRRK